MKAHRLFLALLLPALLAASPLEASMKAPDFAGTDLEGTEHALLQYQGRPLILYFWATWCPACRRDVKQIADVYEKNKDSGVAFLSVSLDQDRQKLAEYVAEQGITFPVLFDGKGWEDPVARAYGVQATPGFVVVTADQNLMGSGSWSTDLTRVYEQMSGKSPAEIKVPDFSGKDLYGTVHTRDMYEGKPLVLYFWATWCPACRQDIGNVQKVFSETRDQGIAFVSVSMDQDRGKLQAYVDQEKIGFPVIFDGKAWEGPVPQAYGINSTPSYVLLAPDHRSMISGHWSKELRKELKKL